MTEKMSLRDWVLISVLTVVVAVISFARLGDLHAPQTSWTPTTGERAVFHFHEPTFLASMFYRMGARHDQGFIIELSVDGEVWSVFDTVEGANVFYWTDKPLGFYTQWLALTPTRHELRLQEVAFRDELGGIITQVHRSPNAWALMDEQHLVPAYNSFMNSTYFDEIYHPRTGYEFVHRLWVYETTHPPLGKVFIAAAVRVFGMTPFGWRFPGTLFGVLMVPLLYAFARVMFKSNNWALFAAFIFSFDFMRFAQTRLATIDTYVTFFVIAMYFCMFMYVKRVEEFATHRKWSDSEFFKKTLPLLALCGAAMGLAIASKWQGVYGAVGLPILFFPALYRVYTTEPRYEKRKTKITFLSCFGFFIFIPLVIYTLSYIPFILAMGGGLRSAWDNQQHMFSYHAGLVAEHGFSSNWWSWPIMVRPIWIYVSRISADVNAGMTSFGNPAVWWTGIGVTVVAVVHLYNRRRAITSDAYIPIFLLVAYAVQFLPWAFVSRLTFIYHYFPSVPFIVLLITWFFMKYVKTRGITFVYAAVVLVLFAFFYPVLSGWPMNPDFVRTFHAWFPGWVFM